MAARRDNGLLGPEQSGPAILVDQILGRSLYSLLQRTAPPPSPLPKWDSMA
jgi:hypothetical protein